MMQVFSHSVQSIPGRVRARPVSVFEDQQFDRASAQSSPLGEDHFMPTHREKIAGNILGQTDGNVLAFKITHREYLSRVAEAMHAEAGPGPGAAKKIAAKIECSDKTTQSWLDGKTAPSGIYDCRAMNRIPAYAALKREIAAMETVLDPRLQAKYQELHALTLALAGAR
jgi:hypothetical protein